MPILNRRAFLGRSAAAGLLTGSGALGALTAERAFAADTSGYKALVCVFFKGGMDHADTILPVDRTEWELLQTQRAGLFNTYGVGSGTSSRDPENILPLLADNPEILGGRTVGLPGEMSPLVDLFSNGELAVVGNVGPLVEPTNRDTYENRTVRLPKSLFSHNDQQSTWMALAAEGARFGWGGRFADAAVASAPGSDSTFASISVGSNDVFLSGQQVIPVTLQNGQAPDVDVLNNRNYLGRSDGSEMARMRLRDALARGDFESDNLFERDIARRAGNAIPLTESYTAATNMAPDLITPFPSSRLGQQLEAVARTMQVRDQLNVRRQIFYVSTGGFDTHNNQAGQLSGLHSNIAASLAAFRNAMVEIGMWQDVTLFTASDFGRTLNDNGDGTDHGWGGHQFVMGGGVNGRRIYGSIPTPDPEGAQFTDRRGRMIPTVSVEQYAATLGNWFGLNTTELADVLPNLVNFDINTSFV